TRRAPARALLIRAATFADDGVRLLQVAFLRLFRRSTRPLVVPFLGHGSPRRVQIGGRVVLGRPDAGARLPTVPDRGVLAPVAPPPTTGRSRRAVLRTSLSRFLTVEVTGATVAVRTPGATVTVRSDPDCYLAAAVDDPG